MLQWLRARIIALVNKGRYLYRYRKNEPICFSFTDNPDAKAIGNPIAVQYPSLHDMLDHVCRFALTQQQLWEGQYMEANAIKIQSVVVDHSRMTGIASFQPCFIPQD